MKQEIDNNAMWAAFRQELALQGELQVVAAIDNALNNLGFTIEETSTIVPIPLKQGEQKPTIEMKSAEESLGIDSETYNKIVDECIYGENKPTDKVESKFHEGDWIVHHGTENIYQVVAVIDNQYQLKYGDNYTIQNCADVDRCARLWDITKDAKDGDVLACNEEILLFKSYSVQGRISVYCWYNGHTNNFFSKEVVGALMTTRNKIYPATKEQRDLLFQKMKEAGYEWDEKKKELKKIEQKSCSQMEKCINCQFNYAGYCNGTCILKNNVQKPAWSKEDECTLNGILADYKSMCKTYRNWLESLKNRVQPQQNQEWSEEDEKMHDFAIRAIELCKQYAINHQVNGYSKLPDVPNRYEELQTWLKFLKNRVQPQNTWKPSDEQIGVIEAVINNRSFQRRHLDSLYEQLKKLREK